MDTRRYFLAPRSGEKSYKNFLSTLKHGVPYGRIEPFLDGHGKDVLRRQEVIYAWANRAGKKAEWERMQPGDTVIFYSKGAFVMAGDVIYKQHSDQLALAMWPADENGQPWSYTYFLTNLRYFKIPLSVFNALSGYKLVALMGFLEINSERLIQLLTHYKSIEDLFVAFSDETSDEIPRPEERVYVNVSTETKTSLSNSTVVAYEPPADASRVSKKQTGYVDFDEINKRNAKTGSLGEEIVLNFERDYLTAKGRADLAEKVVQLSLENTYAGYDIASYDEYGNEKKIEVKATVISQPINFSFNMSRNEIRVAEASDNYYVYLVYGIGTEKPKIHILANPFRDKGLLALEPISYIVKGKFAK